MLGLGLLAGPMQEVGQCLGGVGGDSIFANDAGFGPKLLDEERDGVLLLSGLYIKIDYQQIEFLII